MTGKEAITSSNIKCLIITSFPSAQLKNKFTDYVNVFDMDKLCTDFRLSERTPSAQDDNCIQII